MKRYAFASTLLLAAPVSTTACEFGNLTGVELRAALEEAVESGQVQQLENGVIEITTDFTIGDGVEQVRQHIEEVLVACGSTQVTAMDDVTVLVDFGPADDPCAHEGKLYSGTVELVIGTDGDSIEVTHVYQDLSNGTYTLNGSQDVRWTGNVLEVGAEVERHIVSDLDWHGPRGHVEHHAERTMTFMDWLEGPAQRIRIDGEHEWQREDDQWHLDVDQVELRLVDPVPQSGSYTLTLPNGKQAGLLFERIDDDTIEVTMTGARKDHVFHVTRLGVIEEADA
jgi:hypothetical protein